MQIRIGEDALMVRPVDSRSITPSADVRESQIQNLQPLNGGDIDVMEFKINGATNNPVPTDIFAFKKLSN